MLLPFLKACDGKSFRKFSNIVYKLGAGKGGPGHECLCDQKRGMLVEPQGRFGGRCRMVGTEAGGIQMDRGAFVRVPTPLKAQKGRIDWTVEGKEEASVAGVGQSS